MRIEKYFCDKCNKQILNKNELKNLSDLKNIIFANKINLKNANRNY
jgi:hypothetical protein